MKSRKDFFQLINNFPHSTAVYLTFTLEKEVIDKIAENSNGNIVILHDYRQGVTINNNWNNRLVCIPVNSYSQHQQNCFHSKLALLKGDNKAKLLVGSANLSKDSFLKEKDLCFEIDLEFYSDLYKKVVNYIQSLIPQSHSSTNVLINVINKFDYPNEKTTQVSGIDFIGNSVDKSISDNICNKLKNDEQPVLKIASPFLSSDFKTELSNFLNQVNPKEIQLYLRKSYPLPNELKSFKNLKIFEPKLRSIRNGFHAKLISIEYSDKQIVYIGSANFSRQGFFLNLKQGANQECGIIISSSQRNILEDWFNEGWEKPVDSIERIEDEILIDIPEVIFQIDPYVWAERINSKDIYLFFHIPDSNLLDKVTVDGNKLKLFPKSPDLNIYQCKIKVTGETVQVNIGISFSEKICIFDEHIFEQRAMINNSLFYETNYIDSVNPLKLKEAVSKEGIKVTTLGAVVIEPPILEKYFYNVKNKINAISKRKFFNKDNIQELKTLLENIEEGDGVYFIIHLIKSFEDNKQLILSKMCRDRLKNLLNDSNKFCVSYESFNKFFNKWKKY